MDCTVIVATYGGRRWSELAKERAIPSAYRLTKNVLYIHDETLAQARNYGALLAQTEWLCFLDADDELEAGYLREMGKGTADLRGPKVRYVHDKGERLVLHPVVPLSQGNFLPIGTLVRRDLFIEVGGFHEWPMYEDWDLWIRCQSRGASIEQIPKAVYRAHVSQDSRNEPESETKLKWFNAIREQHFGAVA